MLLSCACVYAHVVEAVITALQLLLARIIQRDSLHHCFPSAMFLVSEYEVIVISCCALAAQSADVCISVHMSTSERTRSAGGMPSWSK